LNFRNPKEESKSGMGGKIFHDSTGTSNLRTVNKNIINIFLTSSYLLTADIIEK
jgi:hypothetical protein